MGPDVTFADERLGTVNAWIGHALKGVKNLGTKGMRDKGVGMAEANVTINWWRIRQRMINLSKRDKVVDKQQAVNSEQADWAKARSVRSMVRKMQTQAEPKLNCPQQSSHYLNDD